MNPRRSLLLPCPARPPSLQSRVDDSLLLDPTADEAFREEAGLLLALMPTSNEVGAAGQLGVGAGRCSILWLLSGAVVAGQPSRPPFVDLLAEQPTH